MLLRVAATARALLQQPSLRVKSLPFKKTSLCPTLPARTTSNILPQTRQFHASGAYKRRVRYTRWDPSEIQHARPLIGGERIRQVGTSPLTRIVLICLAGGGVAFYYTHIEEVPVSGRKRFMFYDEKTLENEAYSLYKNIILENRNAILPSWTPQHRMVSRVMDRLIQGGNLEHVDWEVHVINSEEKNAFVLPGGKVFVYSGILKIAQTDDMLAAILGHEIAHNLAQHSAETMSKYTIIIQPARMILGILDAAGYTLGLGRFLGELILQWGVIPKGSRVQESEADYIGLMMMARSCFNPNAAVTVWQRMVVAEQDAGTHVPEWLSTHPASSNRVKKMQEWLPQAEDARLDSSCGSTSSYQQAFSKAVGGYWVSVP